MVLIVDNLSENSVFLLERPQLQENKNWRSVTLIIWNFQYNPSRMICITAFLPQRTHQGGQPNQDKPGGTNFFWLPSPPRINLEESVRVASPTRINLKEPISSGYPAHTGLTA